ncbi:MAG: hypothetical protein Q9213_005463 [Squamulea squamosa]
MPSAVHQSSAHRTEDIQDVPSSTHNQLVSQSTSLTRGEVNTDVTGARISTPVNGQPNYAHALDVSDCPITSKEEVENSNKGKCGQPCPSSGPTTNHLHQHSSPAGDNSAAKTAPDAADNTDSPMDIAGAVKHHQIGDRRVGRRENPTSDNPAEEIQETVTNIDAPVDVDDLMENL